MSKIKLVVLFSASYSGTTWLNLVLASHPRGLYVGAGERPWNLTAEQAGEACFLHGADCPFWPNFLRRYDRRANVFPQLAAYAKRDLLVLSNPTDQHLEQVRTAGPEFDAKFIKVTRDGRAILASFLRHHPERAQTYYEAARDYLKPSWARNYGRVTDNAGQTLWLRYEDMVTNWRQGLDRVGAFLGIDYDDRAIRFWEHQHHMASGNTAVVDLLRRLQDLPGFEHRRGPYYDRLLEHTRATPEVPRLDESWQSDMTALDRAAYDFVVGPEHETLGYERDRFAPETVIAFLHRHHPPLGGEAPDAAAAASEKSARRRVAWPRLRPRTEAR